jgi:hypothetical protein
LLAGFLDAGYAPAAFATVRPERRDVILRHDVDVSLEAAVRIAELEHGMGVRATYFVMVSNDFYNVFSREGRRLLSRLAELGHSVGLHVDTSLYPPSPDVLGESGPAIENEFKMLAGVVDGPIETISLHNPRPELVNRARPPGGRSYTYEPRFVSAIAYVSDSGGSWRFGGPFERAAFRNGTAFHLLTHPIWWDHDHPTARPELTLEIFAARCRERVQEDLSRHFKDYRELVKGRSACGSR